MEINTEINKVFGREMASLFASHISEEELTKRCEESWKEIINRPYKYGSYEKSVLDGLIKEEIVKRVMVKVDEILRTPKSEEAIRKEAFTIAEEAEKRAHLMMVDTISQNIHDRMFNQYSDSYSINTGCERIASAILNSR